VVACNNSMLVFLDQHQRVVQHQWEWLSNSLILAQCGPVVNYLLILP